MMNAPCMGLVLVGAPDKSAADPTDASQFRRVDTVFIFDLLISLPWFTKNMEPSVLSAYRVQEAAWNQPSVLTAHQRLDGSHPLLQFGRTSWHRLSPASYSPR